MRFPASFLKTQLKTLPFSNSKSNIMEKFSLSLFFFLASFLNSFSQNALHFDGVDDQINCGNSSSVQITGTAITLEAWIYPSSWTNEVWRGNIIVKEAAAWEGYMFRAGDNGRLNFAFGNGSNWTELTSDPNELTLNTWQHVAGSYDGTMMRIYVNGIPVDSLSTSLSISNASTTDLNIGANVPLGRFFPGRIDEARIWNIHRTGAEIAQTMNTELCSQTGLVAYYQFNSGNANGSNTGLTTLTDLSGNGNTGTLSNFALSGTSSNWVNGVTLATAANNTGVDVQNPSCNQFTWIDGITYTSNNNTATYTIPNIAGCDSVITLNLTLGNNQSTSSTDVHVVCDILQWIDGNLYTSDNNTATHTIPNAAGCDSVITLDLTVLGTTFGTDVQTSCTAFTWINGVTYTSSNNTNTFILTNSNGCDSIVTLNLTITTITATDVQTACKPFTWIDGNTYTTDNNSATFMLQTPDGCDSLVTLDLTFQPNDISTSLSQVSLITANENGASYQWLDCDNEMMAIPGAIDQSYSAPALGNYAVEITKNGCTDTSECVEISILGIESNSNIESDVSIFPNPSTGIVHIALTDAYAKGIIRIVDIDGSMILNQSYSSVNNTTMLNLDHIKAGIYFIELQTENKLARSKIILQ